METSHPEGLVAMQSRPRFTSKNFIYDAEPEYLFFLSKQVSVVFGKPIVENKKREILHREVETD